MRRRDPGSLRHLPVAFAAQRTGATLPDGGNRQMGTQGVYRISGNDHLSAFDAAGMRSVLSARAGLASHEGHQVCRRQSAPGRRQCGVRFAGLRGGGVDLLRSICGVCGVLLLGLLLLPVLVELLLFRAVIRLASVAASSLDWCRRCASAGRCSRTVRLYGRGCQSMLRFLYSHALRTDRLWQCAGLAERRAPCLCPPGCTR